MISRIITVATSELLSIGGGRRKRLRRFSEIRGASAALLSAYNSNRDLIAIGAYQRGGDPVVDEALDRWPEIVEFLGQDVARAADLHHSRDALTALLEPGLPHKKENAA